MRETEGGRESGAGERARQRAHARARKRAEGESDRQRERERGRERERERSGTRIVSPTKQPLFCESAICVYDRGFVSVCGCAFVSLSACDIYGIYAHARP